MSAVTSYRRKSASGKAINLRAPAAKQALIDQAAHLMGKNRTEFILDASCERAKEVLADQTSFALSNTTMQRFNAIVDEPVRNVEALKTLISSLRA